MRKHDAAIDDLYSVYQPRHYDSMLLAVQSLAGLNENGTGFKTPSIATSLGTLLKQVGKLCESNCIKKEDEEHQKPAFGGGLSQ